MRRLVLLPYFLFEVKKKVLLQSWYGIEKIQLQLKDAMIVAIFMAGAHYTGLIIPFIKRRFFARVNQQRFHKDSCARENIADS